MSAPLSVSGASQDNSKPLDVEAATFTAFLGAEGTLA